MLNTKYEDFKLLRWENILRNKSFNKILFSTWENLKPSSPSQTGTFSCNLKSTKFQKVKNYFRATQHGLERQSSWQLLMFSVFIMLWNKTNIPDLCCYIICSLISNVVILQGVYPTPYNISSPPSLASVTPLVRRTYLETTDQEMDVWIKLKLHSPTPATVKTLSFTVTPVMGECGVQAMIKL